MAVLIPQKSANDIDQSFLFPSLLLSLFIVLFIYFIDPVYQNAIVYSWRYLALWVSKVDT